MKRLFLAFVLVVAGCAQPPKPSPPVAAAPPSATTARAAPTPLTSAAPVPAPVLVTDPRAILAARQNLKLLGYDSGKSGATINSAMRKAIVAFQKDQAQVPDGRLTIVLADRLKSLRADLSKPASPAQGEVFLYSDGSTRAANFLPLASDLASDAPPTFLQPARPGAQGTFHLGHRAKDGTFAAVATVTCQTDRIAQTNVPAGLFDTFRTVCSESSNAAPPIQWRWFYAARLGLIVRQENGAQGARDLVAIRPSTTGWPSAARTGLDWALTHALEAPAGTAPVQWSSTGVAQQFEITATASLNAREAGLTGDAPCRRFEMVQTGAAPRHYPGVACRDAKGAWFLPGSRAILASPATGLAGQSVAGIAPGG